MKPNLCNIKNLDTFEVIVSYSDKTSSKEIIQYFNDIWWEESHKLMMLDYDMLCYSFLCSDYTEKVSEDIIDELNEILNPDKYFCIKASQSTIIFYNGYLSKKRLFKLRELNKKYDNEFEIRSTCHKTFI